MPDAQFPDGTILRFPEGIDPEVMDRAVQAHIAGGARESTAATPSTTTIGVLSQIGHGLNDGVADLVGAPGDAANFAARHLGAGEPFFGSKGVRAAMDSVLAPAQPKTGTERFAYGAGHGVTDAASMLVPAALAARLGTAGSMVQGVGDTLSQQPVLQAAAGAMGGGATEASGNPGAGFLAAMAVPSASGLARRLISPGATNAPAGYQAMVQAAQGENIPLTAAQITGSKPLAYLESAFDHLPLTSGPAREAANAQQAAFTRAGASRAGIAASDLTPDTLAANQARLGAGYDQVAQQTTLNLGHPDFHNDLLNVMTRYQDKLPSQQRPAFDAYIDDLTSTPNGLLPGSTYQVTRSDLTRQMRGARTSDPFFGQALGGIRDALDGQFARDVPQPLQEQYATLNRQYANQKVLEKAMSGAGTAAATGQLPPAALRGAVAQNVGTSMYARGGGDLNDLARVGQSVLRTPPDSGTAQRAYMISLLTGNAGLAGSTHGAELPMQAAGTAAALLVPRLLQGAYENRYARAYFTNRLAAGIDPTTGAVAGIAGGQGLGTLTGP